jgi:RNA polymerase sigma-70 factor (ECF subfamily)
VGNFLNHKTQQLITLAKEGDKTALNHLCGVYSERVRRIIRLRMGGELRSKLESMDLVQDALIYACKDLGKFNYKNEGDFLRWLSKIAENRIRDNLDKLHAGRRDIRKEIPILDNILTKEEGRVQVFEPARQTTPSMILSQKEDLDKLERAIEKLKPEYREVIILAKIEGLSYQEIGDKLGKSADAAGHLLLRAMMALTDSF